MRDDRTDKEPGPGLSWPRLSSQGSEKQGAQQIQGLMPGNCPRLPNCCPTPIEGMGHVRAGGLLLGVTTGAETRASFPLEGRSVPCRVTMV